MSMGYGSQLPPNTSRRWNLTASGTGHPAFVERTVNELNRISSSINCSQRDPFDSHNLLLVILKIVEFLTASEGGRVREGRVREVQQVLDQQPMLHRHLMMRERERVGRASDR
jgi:hypothetical protein